MGKPQAILCPMDFSELSMEAFRYAEELAISTGADLILAHAFDVPLTLDFAGQTTPANEGLRQELYDIESAIPLKRLLHAGPPGEVICWLAQEHDCDLIIMGTHGRSGISHAFFGSVTEYVMRHARCPVMTMRQVKQDLPPLREPMVLPIPAPRFM